MSYDLMVFEISVAPRGRNEFIEWYNKQTEWSEDHNYQDHAVTSKALQNFFLEFIEKFPPLNGALKSKNVDDSRITDYSIGKHIIYSGFRFSVAEEAYETMRTLAVKHSVGFFDVSSDKGERLFPGVNNVLQFLDFDEIESRIIPFIEKANRFDNSASPVTSELNTDLNIHFGIDNGDLFHLVFHIHLAENYSLKKTRKKSIENLKKLITDDIQMGQREDGLYFFYSKKYFASTILLIDGVWKFAKKDIDDNVIIGIPSVGRVLFVPASNEHLIEQLKQVCAEIFMNEDNALTPQLFKHDGNNLSTYEHDSFT